MVDSRYRSQLLEHRLEARDSQLQLAAELVRLGFWTWEPSTGDIQWSKRCQALLGVAVDAPAVLDTLLERIHPEDQGRVRRSFMQALQTRREFVVEFRVRDANTERRLHCAGRPHASPVDRNNPAFSGVLRDLAVVAKNRFATRAGSLAVRMESIRELERANLINRMKAEVAYNLGSVEAGIAALLGNKQLSAAVRAELQRVAQATQSSIAAVRSVVFELQPPGVAELGFTGALERYATEQAAAASLTLTLSLPQTALPLGPSTLEALYLVACTAIDNVVRHASARNITVSVSSDANEVALRIVDDGVGVSDTDLMKDGSFSLFASSERLASSGGELRVNGTPDKGTVVEAIIPLRHTKLRRIRHDLRLMRIA
jgi:signal transduction histidine kinase